ncbi:S9 family peptidase [Ideonella sp. BN130291]|uniref:S9 family peptidase n=1 Tax=Ideonella sp. BN130291 TaxID=3112940 RepID=UPI002E272461|nr:S9 family peptidase [Ideonella sp. BN130291]
MLNRLLLRLLPHTLALVFCACATDTPTPAAADAASTPVAPRAARVPKDVSVHGDQRIDDYFWLRERDNPEVLAYLRAEAAYTAAWFKPLDGFRERLYQEMLGRVQQADEAVPTRDGAHWYFSRTVEGGQYPVYLRRQAQGTQRRYDPQAPEQVLLDLNEMARGRKFLALGDMAVSPDGRLLAYSTDDTGARDFLLQAKDIATGQPLPWQRHKVSSFQWALDNRTIFYTTDDDAKRSHRLWRHTLGQPGPDTLLYEEKDELFDLQLSHTQDRRYLVLSSVSKDTTELRVLDAATPRAAWRTVLPRRTGREYQLEHRNGLFYLLVNDTGRNFRLVSTPAAKPSLQGARELVAHRPDAMLEQLTMLRGHMVLQEREEGSIKLRVFDFKSGRQHRIAFHEAVYTASASDNPEYDTDSFRFAFQSLTVPPSVYDYDLARQTRTLRKVQPVLGGYDPARYASERVWATATDGTRVPVSLVYRRDLRRPGVPQPTLLYGYGSYGLPMDPRFSSARLSLLDRGVVFAIAHIRGGGDLGRAWYDAGKLERKMTTFTDFISAAEALVQQGFTTPQQLIIQGGSAGGLLMGAVTNLRPDLFKAVVAEVPFLDVINTMLDETLPLTTGEFIEWGNPKIESQYRWMRFYSPYDNLMPGAYPAMYLRTSFNDSQVPYWEPAKYVAKLRTLKTDTQPLLFDINMDAGHGGASGRFDALKERAQVYTFMLQQWGLTAAPN